MSVYVYEPLWRRNISTNAHQDNVREDIGLSENIDIENTLDRLLNISES